MRSFPSAAAMPLTNAAWSSAGSFVTAGSTIFRQTEVLERIAGSFAKNAIHGVAATQSAIALALVLARAISALRPPIDFAQPSASRYSSPHSIDGVLIVSPWKIPSLSLLSLG